MAESVRKGAEVTHDCVYEIAWCVKWRRPELTGAIAERLRELLDEVAGAHDVDLVVVLIEPALVRLTARVDPRFGVHRLVHAMKATSTPALRSEFPELRSRLPTLWTRDYFVRTVGAGSHAPALAEWIESQPTWAEDRGTSR